MYERLLPEIWDLIYSHLLLRDALSLRSTCVRFHSALSKKKVKLMFYKTFRITSHSGIETTIQRFTEEGVADIFDGDRLHFLYDRFSFSVYCCNPVIDCDDTVLIERVSL